MLKFAKSLKYLKNVKLFKKKQSFNFNGKLFFIKRGCCPKSKQQAKSWSNSESLPSMPPTTNNVSRP